MTTYSPEERERYRKILQTVRYEIQTAQIKIALDRKLGRETSPTVLKLAQMDPPKDEDYGL